MKIPDILLAVQPVIQAFEKMSIPYYIGGSIASSVYGMARATMDVDVIADLKVTHIPRLKQILENEYYIDAEMIADAIRTNSSFNLIHFFLKKPAPTVSAILKFRPQCSSNP